MMSRRLHLHGSVVRCSPLYKSTYIAKYFKLEAAAQGVDEVLVMHTVLIMDHKIISSRGTPCILNTKGGYDLQMSPLQDL